jgi:hypothetical protein
MAVIVIGLVVVLLARDRGGPSAAELLDDAPGAVDAAGTAEMALGVALGGEDMDATATGTGAVDFRDGSGAFDVEVLGHRVSVLTDGESLWVLPEGDSTWLVVSGDAASVASVGTGPAQAVALVDLLRDADDAEDLGDEEVDGRSTRHLRFAVAGDIDPALAAVVADDGEARVDVWLDRGALPRRFRVAGETQGVPIAITVDLDDWGSELDLQIPPDGLIRDVEPDELVTIFGGAGP